MMSKKKLSPEMAAAMAAMAARTLRIPKLFDQRHKNIFRVLGMYESAPGAYCMARDHTSEPISDEDREDVYNLDEVETDTLTIGVLNRMSVAELADLAGTLYEIDEEYFEEYGEDYKEKSSDEDVPALLGFPSRDSADADSWD